MSRLSFRPLFTLCTCATLALSLALPCASPAKANDAQAQMLRTAPASAAPETTADAATPDATAPVLRMAVAANFRTAAQALAKRLQDATGQRVRISSASTGVLSAQIRRGAPFDLLLAADQERPAALARDGFGNGDPQCYARGSLVLLGGDNLATALADPALSLAIANPRSAPYGAAARAVLARPEFAAASDRRLVMGSNVQQTAQFFERGAADLALVARAVAFEAALPVPQHWHPPIEQYALVLRRSEHIAAAEAFLTYLGAPQGQQILRQQGYAPCS